MDFGVLMLIRNPPKWRRPPAEFYRYQLDLAVHAEELGFTHIWTSEHHFTEDGWSPSQLPILAAIASRTEKARLGTYVFLTPFHNPIRAAEDVATVDIISNGRLDLACGPAANPVEFATFGVPFKQRRGRMYESMEIIRRCFEEDEFSFTGRYWQFNNVRMTTKPVQKPLPLWAGAHGPKAIAEAAAKGYHLAAGASADEQAIYDKALRAAGRNPSEYKRTPLMYVHLAESNESAWDQAEEHLHYSLAFYHWMSEKQATEGLVSEKEVSHLPAVKELRTGAGGRLAGRIAVGTPDVAVRVLEELFKEMPLTTGVNISMGVPGMDPRHIRNSIELFSKEVMPHFQK